MTAINLDIDDSPSAVAMSDKLESVVVINSPVAAASAGRGAVVVDSPDAAIPAIIQIQHSPQAVSTICVELSLSAPKPFGRRRNAAVAKNEGKLHSNASPVACTAEIPSSLSSQAEHADANEGWGEEGDGWNWVEEEEEEEQAEVDLCVDPEDEESATPTSTCIPHVSSPCESAGGTSRGELVRGASVVLRGLRAAPELNGSLGVLTRFHSDNGRWDVALGGHGTKALKPDNLVVQTSDVSVCSIGAGAAQDDWDWLEEMGYVPGARVVLADVPASPELTGKVGTLVAFDAVSHLWKVEIDGVGVQSFKPANLVVQDDAEAQETGDADVEGCAEECGEEEADAEAGDECVEPDGEDEELPTAKRARTE